MGENNKNCQIMEFNSDRQPRDLQGLLRFAMNATKAEDAPRESQLQEMDPERKKFLEEALNSLTVDVIEELEKAMQTLYHISTSSVDDQLHSLEVIQNFVDNIDTANDFYKIGGFTLILPCLNSDHEEVRVEGSQLIAELSQNNPFCQQHLLELNLLPRLIELLTDKSERVSCSALHAISCMIRGFEPGVIAFSALGGFENVLNILHGSNKKGHVKVGFLINTLAGESTKYQEQFIDLNAVESLSNLLQPTEEYDARIEIILSAICILCDSTKGIERFTKIGNSVTTTLKKMVEMNQGKDDCEEIVDMCQKLAKKIEDKGTKDETAR